MHRIAIHILFNELYTKDSLIIFWNIHSWERIFAKNYWKFKKEDVYTFDYSFEWNDIITHEDYGTRRICFKIESN